MADHDDLSPGVRNALASVEAAAYRDDDLPSINAVLSDPSTSGWLKLALAHALDRDVVDAANDAVVLAALLSRHASDMLAALPRHPGGA